MMRNASHRRTFTFLVGCFLVLMPLCFLGYGSDNDIFTVLDCGRLTWQFHEPDTSRHPGYWVFEAIVYALSRWGGYVATNLATLVVGMVAVWRFLVIAQRMEVRFPRLAAATLVGTPVFAIACTSTMDYVWSLLGVVLFAELLVGDRLALAVLPAAVAFAMRGANGVVIAGAIGGVLMVRGEPRRSLEVIGMGLTAAVLGVLPYVASWRLAGHSFAFLVPLAGPEAMWSPGMRVGRFGYKSVYLFGPLALVVLAWAWMRRRKSGEYGRLAFAGRSPDQAWAAKARRVSWGIVLANALLFLNFPIEISYLIPAAFFFLLLLGTNLLARSRAVAVAFLAAVLSLNLGTPRLFEPDAAGHATRARLHPGLATGVLNDDFRLRSALRGCSDYTCYYKHFHAEGFSADRPARSDRPLE